MSLGFECYQTQRQALSQAQKHTLKLYLNQALALKQKLVDPTFPNCVKGLDGMIIADNLLKQRNCRGILIGGLSEAAWNQKRKLEELAQHKDVDVLVLDKEFEPQEKFEQGVDWWLPYTKKVKIQTALGYEEKNQNYHANGNEVVLGFTAWPWTTNKSRLEPGLYIPSPIWLADMRKYEIYSQIDFSKVDVEVEEEFDEKLLAKLEKNFGKRVPKFINKRFTRQILSSPYEKDQSRLTEVRLSGLSLNQLRAINN